MERHGGTIRFETEQGSGTRFELLFPEAALTAEAARPQAPALEETRGEQVSVRPLDILVAEDEKLLRYCLSHLLEDSGFTVESIATGDGALELLQRQRFDVVITDLGLPNVSGLEIIKEARKRTPECTIILMTGYLVEDRMAELTAVGADHVLCKPFMNEEILKLISGRFEG